MAFIMISKVGAEIGVAQATGKKDIESGQKYTASAIKINIVLGILYGIFLIVFRKDLIGFFNLGNKKVVNMALNYLVIVSLGMNFYFINPVFTAIFNGYGDSHKPFMINAIGLITNIVLDPLLIFGVGPFPKLGVSGAALATIIAQVIVTSTFIYHIKKSKMILFRGFKLFTLVESKYVKTIVRLGIPVAIQNGLFAFFAMIIARIIAKWGETPIAVQKVGSQIEAISWMTAGGFSTAISTFVGQNYGAHKWERVKKGYFTALGIVSIIGVFATCLLIFGARPIFAFFIPEEEAIKYGVVYLKILGLSQFFMCIEIVTAGAFNGLGKTIPPALIGILFTGMRIPAALILSSENLLGLNGVWWSISMSSVFKGVILTTCFVIFIRRYIMIKEREES